MPIDPFLAGTLISGATSLLGAKSAADTGAATAAANLKIAQMNLEFQERARTEGIEAAEAWLQRAMLGQTDAMGNRTYFDEEQGWVTDLTPQQQIIANRVQGEQQRQIGQVAGDADAGRRENIQLSREAARDYNATKQDMQGARPESSNALADLLYARAMGDSNEVLDAAKSQASRSMLNSGTVTPGRMQGIYSGRTAAGANARRDARINSELQARGYVDNKHQQQQANNAGLMEFYGSRAGYTPGYTGTSPTGPAKGGDMGQAQSGLLSATTMTPQQDYQSPDYSGSNALIDAGNTIGGNLFNWGAYQQQKQTDNALLGILEQRQGS